jgi:methylmalonyl-CoA/ethylmalonyl-CoA epimerase
MGILPATGRSVVDHGDSGAQAIDHLAVAVENLDAGVALFRELLGRDPEWIRTAEEHEVRVAMFNLGGVKLELVEPTGPDSSVAHFLQKRGPGLHHVCYAVDDLAATLDRLESAGFEVLGSGEDIGVEGRPVAFLHPRSSGGVLTEFIEGVEDSPAPPESDEDLDG